MPELPEVEVAARTIRIAGRGARIDRVIVPRTRIVRGSSPIAVRRALEGRRVVGVDRRGKWLRIVLDDETRAFAHLGMSGKWVVRGIDDPTERWERLRFDVTKGRKTRSLRYVDPRMFGRFFVARGDVDEWNALGPDPLVDGVDPRRLKDDLARRRITVKEALMDQRVLAGIGNIQATEALFVARIDPRRSADSIDDADARRLARAIDRTVEKTLARALAEEEITYVEEAGAPNPFVVYGRGGEPCPRCRTPFSRTVLGGRGTVWCGDCQR